MMNIQKQVKLIANRSLCIEILRVLNPTFLKCLNSHTGEYSSMSKKLLFTKSLLKYCQSLIQTVVFIEILSFEFIVTYFLQFLL